VFQIATASNRRCERSSARSPSCTTNPSDRTNALVRSLTSSPSARSPTSRAPARKAPITADLEDACTCPDDMTEPHRLLSGECVLRHVQRTENVYRRRLAGESQGHFVAALDRIAVDEAARAALNDAPRRPLGKRDAIPQVRRGCVDAQASRVERPQLFAFASDLVFVGDGFDVVAPANLAARGLVPGHRDSHHEVPMVHTKCPPSERRRKWRPTRQLAIVSVTLIVRHLRPLPSVPSRALCTSRRRGSNRAPRAARFANSRRSSLARSRPISRRAFRCRHRESDETQ
jgi:hypothetical protein